MTTRIFYLVDNEQQAAEVQKSIDGLIERDHVQLIARQDKLPIQKALPEADIDASSDLIGAAKRGAAIGGVLFAGLAVAVIPPIGALATAGLVAGGALLGSWSATLIGVSVPHESVKEYQDAIDNGKILMLVDVDDPALIPKLEARLQSSLPGVTVQSVELAEQA